MLTSTYNNSVFTFFSTCCKIFWLGNNSKLDLEMAKAIGMDSIGVTFGAGKRNELSAFQPVAIVDRFSELEHYL